MSSVLLRNSLETSKSSNSYCSNFNFKQIVMLDLQRHFSVYEQSMMSENSFIGGLELLVKNTI